MPLTKLSSTDAFVVTDIPDAPATGVVRRAPKILQSSAKDLARSATYAFAAFGIERGGASAGINAEGDTEATAAKAFCEELLDRADELHLDPGKGVTAEELAPLREKAGRHQAAGMRSITTTGVVEAARWAAGGDLDGVSVVVEGAGTQDLPDLVARALVDAGATIVEVGQLDTKPWRIWGAEVDLLLCGTKPGTMTHQGAALVKARSVIPWGPQPITTKAYVTLRRDGVQVLPDFVAAAAGLIAEYLPGADGLDSAELAVRAAGRVTEVLEECAGHDEGVMVGAFERAEQFLATWTDVNLFGRPLAA